MKRVFDSLVKFVVLVGFVVLIGLISSSPVQACSADEYGNCGGSCPPGNTCEQTGPNSCSCSPASTPIPPTTAPTNPPPSSCPPPSCTGTKNPPCTSPSFEVCVQNPAPACNNDRWECTGTSGTCTTWSDWSGCYPAPDCVNTRYCTNGTAQPQAQSCTDGAGCGGGGPTATPVPGNSPPTGTLSCPAQIVLGQTGSFTLNGSDVNNNLSSAGLYYSLTGSEHWYDNANTDCNTSPYCPQRVACTGASCSTSASWTPPAVGQYYVTANYYDSAGAKCSGNVFHPLPYLGFYACANPLSNDYCVVNVVTPTPTPIPPICNITAGDTSINYNTATTISWSSTNATSCSIASPGWTGTSGSQSTGNLTSTRTYTCTCSGAGGSGTDSVTVIVGAPPATPVGTCGTFNTVNATTPVTWTWANGTGLRVRETATGAWWYNTWATSPLTIYGIPPGTELYAISTYDFANFSSNGLISPLPSYCPLPTNTTAIISGVLRQKSGTGCYQADASNNFNVSTLTGSTGDSCVTALCVPLPNNSSATSYSCTVTWDNAGCVAQGRQPNTAQTLTMSAAATGYSNGQFSNSSCTLSGTSLTVNAGVNNPNADIAFTFTGNNWIKLKDSSFNGVSITGVTVPAFVTSYDADDNGSKYFIIGNSGAILNQTINPSTAYSSPNNWHASYTKSSSMNPTTFLSYVKSRKQYQTVSDMSSINQDGIYFWQGALTLNNANLNQATASKFVLIVDGNVTINQDKFNIGNCTDASGLKKIAILSKTGTITFSNTTQCAAGIFIAQTIDTGSTGAQGLKIKGNLIAQTTLTNGRAWSDTSQPGLFVVFDPVQYTNLLPYLSTASYEWRQIQ